MIGVCTVAVARVQSLVSIHVLVQHLLPNGATAYLAPIVCPTTVLPDAYTVIFILFDRWPMIYSLVDGFYPANAWVDA